MDDNKVLTDLTEALSLIQTELKLMNKTLSDISSQGNKAVISRNVEGSSPTAYRSRSVGDSSRFSGNRYGSKPSGGFKRSPDTEFEQRETRAEQGGFKTPNRKNATRHAGKLPAKKGGGYPKKVR